MIEYVSYCRKHHLYRTFYIDTKKDSNINTLHNVLNNNCMCPKPLFKPYNKYTKLYYKLFIKIKRKLNAIISI